MRVARLFLLFAGAGLLGLLAAAHLNGVHPALDSVGHFRLHLAVLGLLTAALLLLAKHVLGGAALGVASALSLFITASPTFATGQASAAGPRNATYRLLQANLRFDNATPEEFIRLLGETKPDIATVEEIPDMWAQRLGSVKAAFPYQLICPGRDKIGGVAILSRRPFAQGGITHCDGDGAVAVQSVDIGGQPVTIAAMHLEWPWPKMQPQQLKWLTPLFNRIREAGDPVLIGGDMNATPWSAAVARISQETGAKIVPQVWGTWLFYGLPRKLAPWIGLPIDNILANDGVMIQSVRTQRQIGSDHRPLLVEFSLGAAPSDEEADPPAA